MTTTPDHLQRFADPKSALSDEIEPDPGPGARFLLVQCSGIDLLGSAVFRQFQVRTEKPTDAAIRRDIEEIVAVFDPHVDLGRICWVDMHGGDRYYEPDQDLEDILKGLS